MTQTLKTKVLIIGAGPAGMFVRVMAPHIEGMLVGTHDGLDVGDHVRVTLVRTDAERGYIDFRRS